MSETSNIQELVPLLIVQDIVRSMMFYCEGIGFEVVATWEPGGRVAWCRIERQGAAIMLQQATDEDNPAELRGNGIALFFICDDAKRFHAELLKRSVPATPPLKVFYGMLQVFVSDPDGRELCFESPM